VVGGGPSNSAGNDYSVVGGGRFNYASGYTSTVGGGDVNTASSHYATVPGGFENVASGAFSFAAGARAHALHLGAFVWAGGSIQTSAFSSTGDFQFLINATGGVGIGTNAPQQALSVAGGMNIDHGNANAGNVTNSLRFGSSSGEAIASKRTAGGNQYGLDFYTNSVNRMSIANTGYIGIGTNAPEKTLQIGDQNIVGSEGVIRLESRSSTGSADQRNWEIGVPETDGNVAGKGYSFVIDDTQLGLDPEFMIKWGSGNVGIGVLEPTNILTVQQNSPTDPVADAWGTYSSRRWKDSIVTIESALATVQRLRGVRFVWKADGKRDIGLIAEEVGGVVSEVVAYEANSVDAQSVDYARLVALLIEGMKEQQKQIDALERKLERQTP